MTRLATIVAALALALAASCNKSKKEAVPAEVDVEWPDAAGFPPKTETAPKSPQSGDAGAQPPSDDGASLEPDAAPAPSMSSGSDG